MTALIRMDEDAQKMLRDIRDAYQMPSVGATVRMIVANLPEGHLDIELGKAVDKRDIDRIIRAALDDQTKELKEVV